MVKGTPGIGVSQGELVSVPRCCCTSTYYFSDRLDGPGHGSGSGSGSRLRVGLIGRDFRDPGACLHHHISN